MAARLGPCCCAYLLLAELRPTATLTAGKAGKRGLAVFPGKRKEMQHCSALAISSTHHKTIGDFMRPAREGFEKVSQRRIQSALVKG